MRAVTDRLGVGAPPGLHLAGQAEVDVLHVGVGDSVGYLPGQFGGVGAADEQVTGVQAQGDRGALEHPLHLVAVLDHGSDVRMQHRAHIVLGGNGVDPVQIGQQGGPALLVKLGRVS